jgi:DNA-binding transcriptional LysR family regulator
MKIPTHQLAAFYELAQARNFTKAAKSLHITQSALSQRILNLESDMECTLLIRESAGLRLTEAGETLLRYCQISQGLEREMLSRIKGQQLAGGGEIRIGGFSSVMWSFVVPALGELVRANPHAHVETMARELAELPSMLRSGAIDFAVLDQPSERHDVESQLLGYEENVLVEPLSGNPARVYIDHDAEDMTTLLFLKKQGGKAPKIKRIFMDNLQGVIAGVSEGWGSAVLPRSLAGLCKNARIVEGHRSLEVAVYLHYYGQSHYPALHQELMEAMRLKSRQYLLQRG